MTHLTVVGGTLGGGERSAQSIFEYWVDASAFPIDTHYAALGHLHRRQTIAAGCPVVYSGSPMAIDFGEQDNTPVVCLVEASPMTPAHVTDIPITAARRLRTLRGTVAELLELGAAYPDDYLRVWVTEPTRAGLREEITDELPQVLEVRIDPAFAATPGRASSSAATSQTPEELFAEFYRQQGGEDPRLLALFSELHDELTTADADGSS